MSKFKQQIKNQLLQNELTMVKLGKYNVPAEKPKFTILHNDTVNCVVKLISHELNNMQLTFNCVKKPSNIVDQEINLEQNDQVEKPKRWDNVSNKLGSTSSSGITATLGIASTNVSPIPSIPSIDTKASASAPRAPPRAPKLPTSVDLRSGMPPIYDQGNLGSCVANATIAALSYMNRKVNKNSFYMGSRLYQYFVGRGVDAILDQDASELTSDVGLYVDTGVKSVQQYGILSESLYPYNINKYAYLPPSSVFVTAQQNKTISFSSIVKNLTTLQTYLSNNIPIIIGINAFSSIFTPIQGRIADPTNNQQPIGGHCILIVGYNNTTSLFTIRNSWGTGWGNSGYATISYAYITGNNAFNPVIVNSFTATI